MAFVFEKSSNLSNFSFQNFLINQSCSLVVSKSLIDNLLMNLLIKNTHLVQITSVNILLACISSNFSNLISLKLQLLDFS
jgi:hypothetical protein